MKESNENITYNPNYVKEQDEAFINDRKHVVHSWSIQSKISPRVVNRLEGVHFWDGSGRKYLDLASQLINSNIGHQHPKVVAAIKEQADKCCFVVPSFANEKRSELAKLLSEVTPDGINKFFFTNGGAEANENAIKIARMATGKQKIISRYRSYHGASYGAIALTGDPRRPPVEPSIPGIVRVLDPYCYRCSFGQEPQKCSLECIKHIEEIIQYENATTIAAIIIEPITGSNGIIIPPQEYMNKLRELCDKNKILIIADEVMSGFGRTGEWFGVDNFKLKPDIMTFAKGINSGYVPLGAVGISDEIAKAIDDKFLYCGLTYSGHPLACAAAVATINAYKDEKIIENAKSVGLHLQELMQGLKKKHKSIGDVRSIGLFACFELVKNQATKEPIVPWNGSGEVTAQMDKFLSENGVYMFIRWNFMFICPPLIITKEQITEAIDVIDRALDIADKFVEA